MVVNKMVDEKCIHCAMPLVKATVDYNGLKLEARKCPKCGEKIFTEDLTMKAIAKLESNRLEAMYKKHPIKIGSSLGITLPKDIVEVFNISADTELKIYPQVEKRMLEISV